MNKKELLNGLRYYQKWRKGGDCEMPYPKDVTRYIDSAISLAENASTFNDGNVADLLSGTVERKEVIVRKTS